MLSESLLHIIFNKWTFIDLMSNLMTIRASLRVKSWNSIRTMNSSAPTLQTPLTMFPLCWLNLGSLYFTLTTIGTPCVTHPQAFWRIHYKSKGENNGRKRSWVRSLACNTSGVEGRFGAMGWGLRRLTSNSIIRRTCTNQTTSWLMHSWSTFGAWTSHGQTRTHKIHHGPTLGEATTFPFVIYSVLGHGTNTQVGVLKFPKLGLL
jgi:hypothetical protein